MIAEGSCRGTGHYLKGIPSILLPIFTGFGVFGLLSVWLSRGGWCWFRWFIVTITRAPASDFFSTIFEGFSDDRGCGGTETVLLVVSEMITRERGQQVILQH